MKHEATISEIDAAFAGDAPLANRFMLTKNGGTLRIAFVENYVGHSGGAVDAQKFRFVGAVTVEVGNAIAIRDGLTSVLKGIEDAIAASKVTH